MSSGDCAGNTEFRIGAGIHDITGPVRGREMIGYVMLVPPQLTGGIHMRLRSRAFVIESPCNGKRLVFVSADLGMIFQSVSLEVLRRLDEKVPGVYSAENVILSATHTHSGPGGYSHHFLYEAISLGFDQQNFEVIVGGIVQSIVKAHENLVPGSITIATGDLGDASRNRSPRAYLRNCDEKKYSTNVDQRMTVLKLTGADGTPIGTINWFAVHGTSLGNHNNLISGDNKGYASYLFEKAMGADYAAQKTFVAAFAQSNEGDVSPNIFGRHGDGRAKDEFKTLKTSGLRQFELARRLYDEASTQLVGGVDYRHQYVDFSSVEVASEWTDAGKQKTAPSALGVAKLGGTEDGRGFPFVPEGITTKNINWWDKFARDLVLVPLLGFVKLMLILRLGRRNKHRRRFGRHLALRPAGLGGQGDKPVLLEMGSRRPEPWTPQILPVQVARIGSLAIIAVPFECTTMAGRRIRKVVEERLRDAGVKHCVIAGLSNSYGEYLTTPEEYGRQDYEGASTEFGPWQLGALGQTVAVLATALRDNKPVPPVPRPTALRGDSLDLGSAIHDRAPPFHRLGDVHRNAQAKYRRGKTVTVSFWGGHPNNDLKTQSTYLEVLRRTGDSWTTIARDWDPETRFMSKRWMFITAFSESIVEWTIPKDQEPGEYTIVHYGCGRPESGPIYEYTGSSRVFTVTP